MAVSKPRKPTVSQVLKLVDQLSPEEQDEVRRAFLEDQQDIRIAMERLEKPGKLWSLEEVEQELGQR